MISLTDTSALKSILGHKIGKIGSTALHVSEESVESFEMNMLFACDKICILFEKDYQFGFFENEDGDVFYDYRIVEIGSLSNTSSLRSTVKSKAIFDASEIMQIDIYGRDFNDKDFIPYPDVYQRVKEEKKTDDLFFFNCRKGERLMLVFHPFMPGIEFIYKQYGIESFWNQYGNLYKLHYTIK